MSRISSGRPTGGSGLFDKLFAGGCTAVFIILLGSVAQAVFSFLR